MDARGLQSHVGRARLIALRPTNRVKITEQEPLFSSPPPNPAFEGTRGYAVVCFLGVRPPAPLNSGVGRVEERARELRAAGFAAILGYGYAEW